ncbi:MAG TPA: hypothetical protein VLV32_06130 [Burkholderiales bacterium]|nr:hypothetical protein [Burkholderiales bacterium]
MRIDANPSRSLRNMRLLAAREVNNCHLKLGRLEVVKMGRGLAWLSTGTRESFLEAALFIQTIEKRRGFKIASPEEIAYRKGYISADQLRKLATPLKDSGYGGYLLEILEEPASESP